MCYCGSLVSNHDLISLIRLDSSRNLQANYAIFFILSIFNFPGAVINVILETTHGIAALKPLSTFGFDTYL